MTTTTTSRTVYSFWKKLNQVRHLDIIRKMKFDIPYSVLENGNIDTTYSQDDVTSVRQWPDNNQENRTSLYNLLFIVPFHFRQVTDDY